MSDLQCTFSVFFPSHAKEKQLPQVGISNICIYIYIYHNFTSGNKVFTGNVFLEREKFPYTSWLKPLHSQPTFIKESQLWGWDF